MCVLYSYISAHMYIHATHIYDINANISLESIITISESYCQLNQSFFLMQSKVDTFENAISALKSEMCRRRLSKPVFM